MSFMTELDPRNRFRAHELDGALQFFHPRSGTHVRVSGPHTRHLRKKAPRVVMFGITNECNLSCSFCSREVRRESLWTVDSAFETLRALSDQGVLEVAFGGGEPFVFPGFDELIARLHQHTPLALHVTTNGTQLDRATWARYEGRLGQVRVSVYGDAIWRRCAEVFAETGQRWGANLLVDDAACAKLPLTLAELAAAGCDDVSLLGYVGEPARLLSPPARARLADIAQESPLPCRVSVCFGSSLAVPRLLAGFDNDGDCGAGRDFLTVTPDQRVQACSFQETSFPGATASEILSAWRTQRAALWQPSPRVGCARIHRDGVEPDTLPPIAIWQSFSGNNSGECVMVARFQTIADAQAYLAELLPGWEPDARHADGFSDAWQALFAREQVASLALQPFRERPEALAQIGKNVLATGQGLDDNFPELRALAWKRGALVRPGGIHVHGDVTLFGAIGARDERDRDDVMRVAAGKGMEPLLHGRCVFVRVPGEWEELAKVAEERPVAAELFCEEWTKEDLVSGLQRLGDEPPSRSRLWIRFSALRDGAAEARRFADTLRDQKLVLGPSWVLVDPVLGRKRVAVLAHRRDSYVTALDGERINVRGTFWRRKTPAQKGVKTTARAMPSVEDVREALVRRSLLFRDVSARQLSQHNDTLSVEVATAEPGAVLNELHAVAQELDVLLAPNLGEVDPLHALLRRLRADVL